MSTIIGHNRQREYLNKVLSRDRLAHAYMFSGPEHVGKLTVAKKITQSFFCSKTPKNFENACGACTECINIAENKHLNVFFLDMMHTLVSKKETRKNIPIEDIRELKRQFSLSHAGGWRVVIIGEAEKLTDEAANAFLKLLEEPAERSLFLLTTAHEDLIMPTIQSRAQAIRFGLVAEKDLYEYTKTQVHDPAGVKEKVRLAAGRPGILMRALEASDVFESLVKRDKFMERLLKSSLADMFRTAQKAAEDPETRREAVWFLFAAMRNFYLREHSFDAYAHMVPIIKKLDRIQHIMETTNVNPRLALEVLFIEAKKVYTANS